MFEPEIKNIDKKVSLAKEKKILLKNSLPYVV